MSMGFTNQLLTGSHIVGKRYTDSPRIGHGTGEIHIRWVKPCHKPPIWERFVPTKMVMTGGWFMKLFYAHDLI